MSPDAVSLVMSAKADEVAELAPQLDGLLVIGTAVHSDGNSTCTFSAIRGNRHAVLGVVEQWLASARSYDHGYHQENGRYDAVVARQKQQSGPS